MIHPFLVALNNHMDKNRRAFAVAVVTENTRAGLNKENHSSSPLSLISVPVSLAWHCYHFGTIFRTL